MHGGPDAIFVESLVEDDDYSQVQHSQSNGREIEIIGIEEGKTKVTLTVKSAA